ncbi:uncharacterized protein LOC116923391 [Daphnia magna]|uniref:uncharacterized protein LOC116923391 n=1 Tax=Daphnia magna TaxID=35525 RepID=UPI001E1BB5D2|nr:uncharacterized protein LOC116923391 [Daphnia magna]
MSQLWTRDGSTTSMPYNGIPVHHNRNDTGVGSQSGSSDSRNQTSRTSEERIQAIAVARGEQDTLVVILEQQCREIEQLISNRGRRSILNHLRATRSQADEESFFTMDEYRYSSRPQTPDPTLRQSIDRTSNRYRFDTSRPVSTIGSPPTSEYNPRPLQPSGRGGPPPPLMPSFSSDDWINRRTPPPRGASAGFSPNWLMNALPQIKITPFNGDPKEWPTFISSFRDMIHNVVPSDAQRHAFLKQLLRTEVRSYITEYLDNPSTYYYALVELKKRFGQPQVVARSHLMAFMNLPSIRDDDSEALAKLNRTLHGAMHALRTGGYEQDLESGMTLEHVVSRLPP